MDNSNQPSGYYNYDNKTTKTRLPFKSLGAIVSISLAVVVLIVVAIFVIKTASAENSENEEPGIAWAGENSPLAGIQFLTQNGLSLKQYTDFYHELTEYFKEKHPDYKYVEYVYDTFDIYSGAEEEPADCAVEDLDAYTEEEVGFWNCAEDELADVVMSLKLKADNGDEYKVEIEPDNANDKVTVRIADSESQEDN